MKTMLEKGHDNVSNSRVVRQSWRPGERMGVALCASAQRQHKNERSPFRQLSVEDAWRFAHAVRGLLDLIRPKAKGSQCDELTYTAFKGWCDRSVGAY